MRSRVLRPIGGVMLLAVALAVLAVAAGTAFDYGRGWLVRMHLQDALDAAAHAAAGKDLSRSERLARARCAFGEAKGVAGVPLRITPMVDVFDELVLVSAGTRITTAFIGIAGIDEITVTGSAAVPLRHTHAAAPCEMAREHYAKPDTAVE